ncbi:AN1-type zinc finger protein 2A-like [Amphiura filiformis]|uniref:AN1-type zinc finger protein 2A-like n=1 Tax=Amphiura filiformis TaxID=82378 RepID=UPI003B2194F2
MEFPDVGEHCSEKTCKQLDFLPMKCDACGSIFCRDHILYDKHSCSSSHLKDIQVPVCPLCNKPVPVKRGQQPDIGVSDHIDNECQSDKAIKKRKVYANRCTLKGCKQKELVQVLCDACHKNFCLRHRHTLDHDCKGFQGSGRPISKAGAAAANRTAGSSQQNRSRSKPQTTTLASIGGDLDRERRERMASRPNTQTGRQQAANPSALQAGMSEDEAMARAIQLSLAAEQNSTSKPTSQSPADREAARLQEEEDAALARALAESEQDARNPQSRSRNQQQSSSQSKCQVS